MIEQYRGIIEAVFVWNTETNQGDWLDPDGKIQYNSSYTPKHLPNNVLIPPEEWLYKEHMWKFFPVEQYSNSGQLWYGEYIALYFQEELYILSKNELIKRDKTHPWFNTPNPTWTKEDNLFFKEHLWQLHKFQTKEKQMNCYVCKNKEEAVEKQNLLKKLGVVTDPQMDEGRFLEFISYGKGSKIGGNYNRSGYHKEITWNEFLKEQGLKTNFRVDTTLEEVRDLLLKLAQKAGYPIHSLARTNQIVSIAFDNEDCSTRVGLGGWAKDYELLSIDKAVERLQKMIEDKEIKVAGYKAEVSKGQVKFGCQTIKLETAQEILRRMDTEPIMVDGHPLKISKDEVSYNGHSIHRKTIQNLIERMS